MSKPHEQWTHPSVRKLPENKDPVKVISERARRVVTDALDSGWSGPPFDPFGLADLLKIEVVPRHDVKDARIRPAAGHQLLIEFNPNRSRGRLRFSVAHEIAHTLFEDCADQVRNRVVGEELQGHEWQLEMLCNVAAAEFIMPIGSFPSLGSEELSIDHLLELQKEYEVSMEALLIRVARLTDEPLAVFSASRVERGDLTGRYRLDYAIPSATMGFEMGSGELLPESSRVKECVAIGFTAKSDESWFKNKQTHMECVGLPPYPGSRFPRVAGFIRSSGDQDQRAHITYLRGDATQPRTRPAVIGQVVNDATPNWGGASFAVAIGQKWPVVQDSFQDWVAPDARPTLGTVHVEAAEQALWVASMVAQRGYGPSARPRIRYTALRDCMREVGALAADVSASIHVPRLGCGGGGGDWAVVAEMIRNEWIGEGLDVTVYDLPGSDPPVADQVSLEFSSPD